MAFGACDCRDRSSRPLVKSLCDRVLARLDQLSHLTGSQLRNIDEEETAEMSVGGKPAFVTVHRSNLDGGRALIVVQGFVATLRWPTVIGTDGIGHVVAEGLVVSPDDTIAPAPDELMWGYR